MLQEDPELFQLYKDLVVSQVISAEEFWANRKVRLAGFLGCLLSMYALLLSVLSILWTSGSKISNLFSGTALNVTVKLHNIFALRMPEVVAMTNYLI